MYVPKDFSVQDRGTLVAFIEREAFGILTSWSDAGPVATHAPFVVLEKEPLTLGLHVAKPNPQWKTIDGQTVLAVFQGAHAMVSAGWYADPHSTVPTWDYAAVHCTGTARVASAEGTRRIVERLVAQFESSWRIEDADAEYIARMERGIVGIEFAVARIEGAFKYSQNRTPEDRERVIAALESSSRAMDRELAKDMRAMPR